MEYLFPEYRLDWFGAGPSSPNKTGALLAILFVVAWWPALRYRWGFWLSLPLAFVAAGLLLQTESRGALVAAGAAVVLLSVFQFSVRNRQAALRWCAEEQRPCVLRIVSLLCAIGVLAVYAQQLGVNDRMAAIASGEDGSSNVRVALYSAGLQMIADAPLGWGAGQAGDAYGQWYQEIGDSRSYLSLVNSHLTWMAEGGLLFLFLYIAGWCFVLLLCWPVDATGVASLRLVAFSVWVTLGVCGFFSSVLTLVWLWVVPAVLLLACIVQRFRLKLWPTKRQRLGLSFVVLAAFVGLQATAHAFSNSIRMEASPSRIEMGENPNAIALVQPNRQILGDKYGHTIREYLSEIGGLTVLRNASNGADWLAFDTIVVSGNAELPDLGDFRGKVVWMNPPAEIGEAELEKLESHSLTVVIGSLGDWRRSRVWQSVVGENPNWNLNELRGVADFIPNWPRYLEPLMDVNGR